MLLNKFHTVIALFIALLSFAQAQETLLNNAITAPITGDKIVAGETYTIEWTNKEGSKVTLTLIDGSQSQLNDVATIVTGAANTGSYVWEVPASIPASTDFAIRIAVSNDPTKVNYSDRFTFESDVVATASSSETGSAKYITATAESSSSSESASSTEFETTTTTESTLITSASIKSNTTTTHSRESSEPPVTTTPVGTQSRNSGTQTSKVPVPSNSGSAGNKAFAVGSSKEMIVGSFMGLAGLMAAGVFFEL